MKVTRMKHFANGHTEEIIEERPDPALDLKAVEARLEQGPAWIADVLFRHFPTSDANQETRTVLTDLLPIADSVPPIAARIRAVLAKATERQP